MLEQHHPETAVNVNNSQIEDLVHVHFKDVNYFVEYTPLLVTYLALLLYLYFSVREYLMITLTVCLKRSFTFAECLRAPIALGEYSSSS